MNNDNGWWRLILQKKIIQKSAYCHVLDFDGLMKSNVTMTLPW
jgi:hypothetical protein